MKNFLLHYHRVYYLIFFIGLPVLYSSCRKDWFDIKADKNLTVPATLQDFELLLDNFDVMTRGTVGLGEVAVDGYHVTDVAWNITTEYMISDFTNLRNAYTWTNIFPYKVVNDWNNSYKKVFNCNLVLDGLEKISITSANELQYNAIKGNALFIKAKTMFELAGIYAEPYNESSSYGMILKEGINVTEKKSRSSVKNTYDGIVFDLNQAVGLLPLRNVLLTRASKMSCWALLARVYLNMGQYQLAHRFSDSVLKYNGSLLEFSSIPTPNSSLDLFNKEVIFHSEMQMYIYTHPAFYLIDNELLDSYDANDLRKELYFEPVDGGYVFKGMYNSNNVLNFSGLATDEMYLIRAECFARENNMTNAMGDLNKLLRTRYKVNLDGSTTYVDKTAGNETEALTIILEERRKELVKRGLRWTDLRRINADSRFQKTIHRSIGGDNFTLEPLSYKYTFPFPEDEMAQNSNLVQNPEW